MRWLRRSPHSEPQSSSFSVEPFIAGQSIQIVVTNDGPEADFTARVLSLKGSTERLSIPSWRIPWKGSSGNYRHIPEHERGILSLAECEVTPMAGGTTPLAQIRFMTAAAAPGWMTVWRQAVQSAEGLAAQCCLATVVEISTVPRSYELTKRFEIGFKPSLNPRIVGLG